MKNEIINSRKEMIFTQGNDLFLIIQQNINDQDNLQDILNRRKFKPDSIRLAIKLCKDNNIQIPETINNYYIENILVPPKTRAFSFAGEKTTGKAPGKLVRKTPNDINENSLKYQSIWMDKEAHSNPEVAVGTTICEYISTNIVNQIMGENSPKLRLHKNDNNKITLLSKFIPDFSTLLDMTKKNKSATIKDAHGFASFFVANALVANADLNSGNIGIRVDEEGNKHIASIDTGMALFFSNFKETDGRNAIDSFKDSLLQRRNIYSANLFDNDTFANEVEQTLNNIDLNLISKVVKKSIYNLELAYGEDFLKMPAVERLLRARIGITKEKDLNSQTLEDAIINNVTVMKNQLSEMSQKLKHNVTKQISDISENDINISIKDRLSSDISCITDIESVSSSLSPLPSPRSDPAQTQHEER